MTIKSLLKQWLAKLVHFPPIRFVMLIGIRLFVPRHRMGVVVIVFNEQGNLLLLRHVFHPELPWGPPGGWLGRGEDPAKGVMRELKEETGLTAVLGPIIYASREPGPDHVGLAYVAHVTGEPSLHLSSEILEANWFPPDQLPPVYPFTKQAVANAIAHLPRE